MKDIIEAMVLERRLSRRIKNCVRKAVACGKTITFREISERTGADLEMVNRVVLDYLEKPWNRFYRPVRKRSHADGDA
jgi:hypothetical protein